MIVLHIGVDVGQFVDLDDDCCDDDCSNVEPEDVSTRAHSAVAAAFSARFVRLPKLSN